MNKQTTEKARHFQQMDLWDQACTWFKAGRKCGLATVASTWGTAPNPVGSQLLFSIDGSFQGSVSGGCIESAVMSEGLSLLNAAPDSLEAHPTVKHYGVSDELAWSVGLTCGGRIAVYIEALNSAKCEILAQAHHLQSERGAFAMHHSQMEDSLRICKEASDVAHDDEEQTTFWRDGNGKLVGKGEQQSLYVMYRPAIRLIIIGGVAIAQYLVAMMDTFSWHVVIVDPRQGWASPERFPNRNVDHSWPEDYFSKHALDASSAVVALCHDPKIDDAAVTAALTSDAFYVGALGSKRTNAQRKIRLGIFPGVLERWDRLHAPIGLDIGARSADEIAVSILAQLIAQRRQKLA